MSNSGVIIVWLPSEFISTRLVCFETKTFSHYLRNDTAYVTVMLIADVILLFSLKLKLKGRSECRNDVLDVTKRYKKTKWAQEQR